MHAFSDQLSAFSLNNPLRRIRSMSGEHANDGGPALSADA
jgi:hypothetical protein